MATSRSRPRVQSRKKLSPTETCEHCGDAVGENDWIVTGEGKVLHLERPPCFEEYRKARNYSEVSKGGI